MNGGLSICSYCDDPFTLGEGYTKKFCCSSCYTKNYYQDNKEKLKEYRRQYYSTHKDVVAKQRKYYTRNRDKLREDNNSYYWSHRSEIIERAKQKRKKERVQTSELRKAEQFSHILSSLRLGEYHSSYQDVCDLLQEITKPLPGDVYKKLDRELKLFPALLFLFLKLNGENISITTYSEAFQYLDRDGFKHDLIQLKKLSSGYRARNRKAIIKIKLRNLMYTFELGEQFLATMVIISEMFWIQLRETTDDVATGTIYALALLKWGNTTPTISKVCKDLGIASSSVLYQVKNKVLPKTDKSKFKTIIEAKRAIVRVIDQKQQKMRIHSLYMPIANLISKNKIQEI